ncbi:Ribonuclease H1 [Coemansia sp. RSA 1290]|nr:Ribonuclease H1 [Coemansia sp. RSA 1290]
MERKERDDEAGWQFVYIRNVDFNRVHKQVARVWDELQIDSTKVAYSGSVGEYTKEFIVQCNYVEQFVTKFQAANTLNPTTALESSSHLVARDLDYSPIAPHLRYLPPAASPQALNALNQYARESLCKRWSRIYFTAEQPAVRKLVYESLAAYGLSPQFTEPIRSCTSNTPSYACAEAINVVRQWAPNQAILSPDHLAELVPKPSPNRLVIYADGAYLHERKRAGVGVYFENSSIKPLACPLPGHQSAARAEVYAVYMAFVRLRATGVQMNFNEIWVCSDSQYVVDAVNLHRETWQRSNWLTAKGKPVANRTVFELLFDSISDFTNHGFTVFVHHLPGHAGIAGNEAADVLAKAGALL